MPEAFEDRTLSYVVGDKILMMKPLTLGQLKKALQVVESAGASLMQAGPKDPVAFVQTLPPIIAGKFVEIAPILFPNQGLTKEWIDENFDVPMARKVIMDAARINDVTDFLVHLRGQMESQVPVAKV